MRAILTYHSIDESGSPISVTPSVFAQHVKWLRSGRVRVTSIPELLALPLDADAVSLTFDDGFCNFATEAAPLLGGLPVTLFVVTDYVGRYNVWHTVGAPRVPTLPLLDWPELCRMADSGVTLGAHTRTHADLTTLAPDALLEEVSGSARRIRSETGRTAELFAYPYGRTNRTVAAVVKGVFRWACTTELRALPKKDQSAELPRLDMYFLRRPGQLEAWDTPTFHAYLTCRRILRRYRPFPLQMLASRADS